MGFRLPGTVTIFIAKPSFCGGLVNLNDPHSFRPTVRADDSRDPNGETKQATAVRAGRLVRFDVNPRTACIADDRLSTGHHAEIPAASATVLEGRFHGFDP